MVVYGDTTWINQTTPKTKYQEIYPSPTPTTVFYDGRKWAVEKRLKMAFSLSSKASARLFLSKASTAAACLCTAACEKKRSSETVASGGLNVESIYSGNSFFEFAGGISACTQTLTALCLWYKLSGFPLHGGLGWNLIKSTKTKSGIWLLFLKSSYPKSTKICLRKVCW